jgi:hypothetical protein
MERPDRKRIDALVIVTRAAFGERGQRSPVKIFLTLAVPVALLVLVIWLLWPRPRLPQLVVAAYDQIARPDETVTLCARVEPLHDEGQALDLSGCELYFQDVRTQGLLAQVPTGRDGSAFTEQSFPTGAGLVQVIVRYSGEKQGQRGAQADGRVFVWPADARLLVVDVDHALAAVDEDGLWAVNNLDIRPQPGAAKALQQLKDKYHIVYLSAGAYRPSRYNKLRAWLGMRGQEAFPDGPLVARVCRASQPDAKAFRRAALEDLTARFSGPPVGVATGREEVRALHSAGLKAFLVGQSAKAPEGITMVKTWQELSKVLPK